MRLPHEMQAKLDEHMKQVPRLESIDSALDICYHLSEAHKYAQCGEDAYFESEEKQAAIMFRMLCAGEAAKQFCDLHEGRERGVKSRLEQPNEDIEKVSLDRAQWRAMHKLRDSLAHNPTEPDAFETWRFVSEEVPTLLPVFKRIVMHYSPEQLFESPTPARFRAFPVIFGEFETAAKDAISQLEGFLAKLEEKHPGIKEEAERLREAGRRK